MSKFIISMLLIATATLPQWAFAHPADLAVPLEVDTRYGTEGYGYPPDWSLGELTFTAQRPSREQLSHAERYILAGADLRGKNLKPWKLEVWQLVMAYESRYGHVPSELSDEIVRDLMGEKTLGRIRGQCLVSPISGRYPKLMSETFSPGDVYMRPLNAEELKWFARYDRHLLKLAYEGVVPDARTGKLKRAPLLGKVWYMRVYGHNGIITEDLLYAAAGK